MRYHRNSSGALYFDDDPSRFVAQSVTWVAQTSYVQPYQDCAAFYVPVGFHAFKWARQLYRSCTFSSSAFPAAAHIGGAMVVEPMTRAFFICAAVLATRIATSNSAQDSVPGEIISVGQNTYRIRLVNEPIDVADRRAMKRAGEYCARMKQTMVVRDKTFDMGYGYTLTWSCLPP
jgi:hypothetical protein